MNKQALMLSAAMAALFSGQALADTSVSTATTTALTTGPAWTSSAITTAVGTPNAGNITIASGGTVTVNTTGIGVITVDDNSFVSNVGGIASKDVGTVSGILIDVSKNPNPTISTNTANTSAFGIDSTGTITLSGSGTTKYGVFLDSINGTGTYTGNITLESASITSIQGDSGVGVFVADGATLAGNLSFGGSLSLTQTTATQTTTSSLFGLLMDGQVNGNILLPAGGTVKVNGASATGLAIEGTGLTGSLSIGGTLQTVGISTTVAQSSVTSTTIFPEAGSALVVAANVGQGIAILGPLTVGDTATAHASVSSQGTSSTPTVVIDPGLNTINPAPSAPTTIGVYNDTVDPGFSFYNRGTIQQTSANPGASTWAMEIAGSSAVGQMVLTGGIFNSGAITAQSTTTGTTASGSNALAVSINNYAVIGTGSNKIAASGNNPGDQAALVNSNGSGVGTISATVSGTRGGTANALYIGANSTLSSIINSGKIFAVASVTDATITGPLSAVAIDDASGSLTSIYNTGTISASAGVGTASSTLTALDSNAQQAIAIILNGSVASSGCPTCGTPSGSGVTITDQATTNGSASITGGINFGTGDNQVVNVFGASTSLVASVVGNLNYGSGTSLGGDQLKIGAFGVFSGAVYAPGPVGVAVDVQNNGVLALQNAATSAGVIAKTLNATTFKIENGASLSLFVSESLTSTGVVAATQSATIAPGANLGVAYASFVPQGSDQFVLITAPTGQLSIQPATINLYNTSLTTNTVNGGALPFLFESASLGTDTSGNLDQLVLNVVPKTATQLGLTTGSAGAQLFGLVNTALGKDDALGSAMVNGVANVAQAQAAYDSFAPNVTGGSRAIAISITDQATGVIAARQRALRLYGSEEGEETLWGQEFAQMIKDPGRGAIDPNTVNSGAPGAVATGYRIQPGFKDHGFGFAIGMDSGSPKYGWYGGALTFYTGDVGELARDDHTNEQWYLLSGYSAWRGKGLFFDSKIDLGYGSFKGKRYISLAIPNSTGTNTYTREADNTHAGELVSGGFTTGGLFTYGATTLMPQISVDGLIMREEGYTEKNPGTATVGDGFDLQVQPYYAQSLRVFLGASVRYDINLWDFYLQPEARAGYRYDVFNDPVKLKAAFAYAGAAGAPGTSFTFVGPDPSQGNFVVGGSLASTTDTWTMGLNFDLVRGSSGGFDEVGTFNLVGRI